MAREGDLNGFVSRYSFLFQFRAHSVLAQAQSYFKGLFCTEKGKRNIERMCEATKQNYQKQHHFLSHSPWSAQEVMNFTAQDCNQRLGHYQNQCLSIDETAQAKSGKYTVGVSRQYNGNLGKVDNCQTGVFASLSKEDVVGLVNCRLFLPDEWVDDKKRCKNAGIPLKAQVKKTKPELGLDMIKELKDLGIQWGWINADSAYGSSYDFASQLEDWKMDFVLDIRKNQVIYTQDPQPYLPEYNGKGRKPKKRKTDHKPLTVEEYLQKGDLTFTQVKVRKGTKGWIKASAHAQQVWVWDGKEEKARQRTLIIRKTGGKAEVKFALSNLSLEQKTLQELVFMQAQRYFIERAFQDAKGEIGMADQQVRKYNAWYHHQAFVMMAMDYINMKKLEHQENIPLLSIRDIRLQIIATQMENGVQMETEIEQMMVRHRQRQRDINRYYPDNQSL